jgi:orotidine-5'-phosphate decarboxylase
MPPRDNAYDSEGDLIDWLIQQQCGVMPALDVDSFEDMLELVSSTCEIPGVVGYKLGLTGVLPKGLPVAVRAIRERTGLPIIYDHQKAGPDMPDMAPKFSKLCREAGVDGLVLFPVAGPTAVKSFTSAAVQSSLLPLVGGHIPVPDYCLSGSGYMRDDVLDCIIDAAAQSGARGFILPSNLPAQITRHCRWIAKHVRNPFVFLTGIGALGGTISTAFKAAQQVEPRFAIVGRAISLAKNREVATKQIIDEIYQACGI